MVAKARQADLNVKLPKNAEISPTQLSLRFTENGLKISREWQL